MFTQGEEPFEPVEKVQGGNEREPVVHDGRDRSLRGCERGRGGGRTQAAQEVQAPHAQPDSLGRRDLSGQGRARG